MANAVSYMRNVTKSIKYSAIDSMKKMNPVVTSFYQTNEDVLNETYRAIKDIKNTTKDTYSKAVESEVGGLAKTYFRNLMEDAKSGKFYNKERIEKDTEEASRAYAGFDDDDFGIDFDEDVTFDDEISESSTGRISTNDIDAIAEKSTSAVGQIMARTAQYQVEAQRQSTKVLYDQNAVIFGKMHSSLGAINSNIGLIFNYMKENTNIHYENSRTFYESTTNTLNQTNEILKEMLEIQKKQMEMVEKSYRSDDKVRFSDIFSAEGALDIKAYARLIKQNMNDNTNGIGDMMQMFMQPEILKTLVSSPLQGITDAVVKMVTPKMLKDAFGDFNKSLSGFFSSFIMKMGDYGDSNYGVMANIAKMLGYKDKLKTNFDTANYNKGAVPFDGVTRKAIIDVIPTYLSKIYTAVSGSNETRYDYERGKFVTTDSLKKELQSIFDQSSNSASYDIKREFENYSKAFSFKGGKEQEEQYKKDMKLFFDYYFRQAKLYNKKLKARDYGMTSKYSEENLALFQKMWEQLPAGLKMQYASNVMESRETFNRRMENAESDSLTPLLSLFNGSLDDTMAVTTKLGNTTGVNKAKKKEKGKNKKKKNKVNNTVVGIDVDEDSFSRIAEERLDQYHDENVENNLSILGGITQTILEDTKPVKSAQKALNKPSSLIAKILNKIDEHLYTFVFGDDKFDADADNNGMLNAIFHKISESFDNFNIWLDQNVLFPLRDRFNKEKIKDITKNFFGMFGIDIEEVGNKAKDFLFGNKKTGEDGLFTQFNNQVKEGFKGLGSYVKQSFIDIGDYFGVFGKKNARGEAKTRKNKEIKKAAKEYRKESKTGVDQNEAEESLLNRVINADDEYKRETGIGSVENAAEGIKRVSKTGVIVASEGELIIPPDKNPFNISRRYRKENKEKNKFLTHIKNYADGGTVEYDKDRVNKNVKDAFKMREYLNRDDYEDLHLGYKVADELKKLFDLIKGTVSDLTGKAKDKIGNTEFGKNGFSDALGDVMSRIKEYAPDMAVGGITGAGVSLLTGAIGGPLLGAASGAAISLIKNSDKVQNWLFGEMKDGERQGGLLSKDLSNNIQKYMPDMAKGATVGAITSILPFVPGGPVAGIILGSSIGFAKNNETIQQKLFGEEGLLGKNFKEKVKTALPKMGAGAVVGLLGGPFGITTNILLGSAIGFASDTKAFKELIFGKKDENGNTEGGLLEMLKESVIEPNKEFFGNMFKEFKDWFNKDIKDNINKFIGPMQQDIKNLSRNLYRHIKKKVDNLFDKFMQSRIGQKIDKTLQGLNNIFQGTVGKVFGLGKNMVSLPFRALGRYGDFRRTRQIKSGNADMLSAAERMAYRDTDAFKKRSRFYNKKDNTYDLDLAMSKMSDEEIKTFEDTYGYAFNAKDKIKKDKTNAIHNMASLKELSFVDDKIYKQLLANAKTGNIEQVNAIIDGLGSTYTDKKGNVRTLDKDQIKRVVTESSQTLKKASDAEQNIDKYQNEAREKFKEVYGFDVEAIGTRKVEDYLKAERKFRGLDKKEKYNQDAEKSIEEQIDDKQQERHKEVVAQFEQINYYLRMIVDDDFREKELKKNNKKEETKKEEENKNQLPSLISDNIDQNNDEEIESFDGDIIDENGKPIKKSSIRAKFDQIRNRVKNSKFAQAVSNAFGPMTAEASEVDNNNFLPAVRTEFYQGKSIQYTKTKDGSYIPDKSDSETVEAINAINEDRQVQKGILNSLTSIPGKILSFFGKKDGQKEDKKEGIFSKILKKAGKVAMLGALIAFAPKIYDFFNETVKPIVVDFIDGFKAGWNDLPEMFENGAGKIGQLFGDKIHDGLSFVKDWLSGTGQFDGKGLPYIFEDKIIPSICYGFEFIMSKVVPKAAEIIVKSLPSIIWGGVKGLGSLIGGVVSGFFNKDDKRDNREEQNGPDVSIEGIDVKKSTKINYQPSNAWNTSGSISTSVDTGGLTSAVSNSSDSGNITVKSLDKAKTAIGATSQRRKETKSVSDNLPKAFSYTNKYQQRKAIDSYNSVKDNVISVEGYGDMTISELLNRDDIVVGTTTDSNGNPVNITGADILNYPEIASQFGIDSQLTEEELLQATKDDAGSSYGAGVYDLKSKVAESGVRAFASGRTGRISKAIGKVGNFLGKSSVKSAKKAGSKLLKGKVRGSVMSAMSASAKKAGSIGLTSLSKGLNTLSDLGARKLPTEIVGSKNKSEAIFRSINNTISKTETKEPGMIGKLGHKLSNTTVGKKVSELGTEALTKFRKSASKIVDKFDSSLIGKLIQKVKSLIPDLFTNSKLVGFIKGFMSDASEKLSKEALEKALKTFGEKLGSKIASKLGEQSIKLVGKVATKVSAFVGTAGLSTILFAVTGFISGWRNADQLLNIKEPSFLQKLISGAVYALNDTFCFGLLPLEAIFDIAFDIASNIPAFNGVVENLREQQKELSDEVTQYNMQNGTDLTVDEYLDKRKKDKSILHKAWNGVKSVGSGIVNGAKAIGGSAVNAGKFIATKATGAVDSVKNFFGNIFGSKKTDEDDVYTTTNNTKEVNGQVNSEDYTISKYADAIENQNKVLTSPLALLSKSAQILQDQLSDQLERFKKLSKDVETESDSTVKKADGSDMKNYWKTKKSGTGLSGTFMNLFGAMQKIVLFPVTLTNNIISTLSKPFKTIVNKVKTNPVISTVGKGVNSILKFLGLKKDDSTTETSESVLTGSGSGLKSFISGSGSGSNKSTDDVYHSKPISELTSVSDMKQMKKDQLFVSQTNDILSNKRFNTDQDTKKQTVADAGCAPAVSTMAINLANRSGITNSTQTFSNAINNALNYKVSDEGVTADYFIDEFKNKGMSTAFISSSSPSSMKDSIINMLKGNKPVVLMGADSGNTTKKKSPFGPNGHYVLATGISEDGKYIYINDPESKVPNIKYPIDNLMKSVNLGIAPVKKSRKLDNKTKTSKVSSFMKQFRGSSLTGNSNEEKVWNFFISQGFSEAATAGVMGNIYVESHFNPSIHQIGGGPGRGLCQWEASSSGGSGRYNGLVAFANQRGTSWDDLQTQLEFVIKEITDGTMTPFFSYVGGLDKYMKSTEPRQAAKDWLIAYELCGTNYNFDNFDISTRQSKAEEYYKQFTGQGVPGTLSTSFGTATDGSTTTVSTPAWQKENPSILDLYTIFDDLAKVYGLTSEDSSVTTTTGDSQYTGSVSGATVSDAQKAELQRKMANSFIKSENAIKGYSQSDRYSYNIADDGTITGTNADCSSLVQGVYKKFLNVDPGSWTGAMLSSSNTYTVEKGTGYPGSAPTESKMQLGDLVVYGPSPSGSHVEMYVGDGKTMGHGSAPGPHYASNSSIVDGKLQNWQSQNKGLNEVRRWVGFQGAGSGLNKKSNRSRIANMITKNGRSYRKILSGSGSDMTGKSYEYITSNYDNGSSNNILSDIFGENISSNIYKYSKSTGSDVYATVNNNSTNVSSNNSGSNSAQLIEMLKSIVKILVKLVDNSDNMKQIVSLLAQLVQVVSNTNDDNNSNTKLDKTSTAANLKANLLNTINTASKSNPDKELIDIINNMEALASM